LTQYLSEGYIYRFESGDTLTAEESGAHVAVCRQLVKRGYLILVRQLSPYEARDRYCRMRYAKGKKIGNYRMTASMQEVYQITDAGREKLKEKRTFPSKR